MERVRLGVIGCGGMAKSHMNYFKDIPNLEFTAAADSFADNLKSVVDTYGVKGFESGHDLIKSGLVDAILIVTPHYFHPEYAIAGFENGLHVMTEKPVAVTAKAAKQMNDAADAHPHLLYGAMFQMRMRPDFRFIKQAMVDGTLGDFRRFTWIGTDWFRSQAYYDSGSWRATWKGEGGGVLLNQCPHDIDMLYWLFGLPKRITANITLGKYHNIEVEDDVSAIWEYENGATGVFVVNTSEKLGVKHIEVVGDRGRIEGQPDGSLKMATMNMSADEAIKNGEMWSIPGFARTDFNVTPSKLEGGPHQATLTAFLDAIVADDASKILAPGRDGLGSLELINAMIMSGVTGKPVDLPTDHDAYEALMAELIAKSEKNK